MVKGARLQPRTAMKRPNLAPESPGWGFESAVLARTRPCETRPRTCSEHQGLAKKSKGHSAQNAMQCEPPVDNVTAEAACAQAPAAAIPLKVWAASEAYESSIKRIHLAAQVEFGEPRRRKSATLIDELHSLIACERSLFPGQGVLA
jgi:hypothetical protein